MRGRHLIHVRPRLDLAQVSAIILFFRTSRTASRLTPECTELVSHHAQKKKNAWL